MNSVTKDLRKKTNEELTDIISKLKTQLLEIRFSVSN
ncbi:50S ribosomal protein L29, partial [bacterium]|nr:50S ribosomal protein L29 [bacterium]